MSHNNLEKINHFLAAFSIMITLAVAFSSCTENNENATNQQNPEVHTTVDISLENNNDQPTPQQEPQEETQQETSPNDQTETNTNTSSNLTDNPEYLSWAKYGIGTQLTYENITESQGTTQQSVLLYTLTEKNDDSITYEVRAQTNIDGQDTEIPADQQIISAKIPSDKPTRRNQIPGVKIIEEKEESVTIGDRTFNTRVTKFETQGGEEPHTFSSITTLWESDEVPGRTVRMESTTNTGETTYSSTLVLKDLKIK